MTTETDHQDDQSDDELPPDLDLSTELPLGDEPPVTDDQVAAWAAWAEDDGDGIDKAPADHVWRVEDQEAADRAGRRWARAAEVCDEFDAQRDTLRAEILAAQAAQLAKVDAWHSKVTAKPERDRAFYAATIRGYLERLRTDSNDKIKSIRLPSVRVSSRKPDPYAQLAKTDTATADVLAWVKSLGDAGTEAIDHVPARDKLMMAKVKRLVDIVGDTVIDPATGEVIPGLVVVPAKLTVELERNDGDLA